MNIPENNYYPYSGIQKSFEKALHTYDDEAIIQLTLLGDCPNFLVAVLGLVAMSLQAAFGGGQTALAVC